MKKIVRILTIAFLIASALPVQAQEVRHGSDDFKIGVAGYSYRKFSIDQTLQFLQDMGVKYFSVKDWWLPLGSTKEQMDDFKAKCASYGVEGYILGPIYMKIVEQVGAILKEELKKMGLTLIDFKIEIGFDEDGKVYVVDEITPDIWRVKDKNGVIPNQIDCAKLILEKI